jgi:hypothetical protein
MLCWSPQIFRLLHAAFSVDPSAAVENFGRFIGDGTLMFRATHRPAETP